MSRARKVAFLGMLCLLGWARPGNAHVAFTTEAGMVLTPGSVVTIVWRDVIPHDTLGYQLEFIQDETAAPERIASDLPPGTFQFDWLVPNVECSTCQLHVIQDNGSYDYEAFLNIQIGVSGAGGASGQAEAAVTLTSAGGMLTSTSDTSSTSGSDTSSASASGTNSTGASGAMGSDAAGVTTAMSSATSSGEDGTALPNDRSAGGSCSMGIGASRAPSWLWLVVLGWWARRRVG